jgi:plastocyanin
MLGEVRFRVPLPVLIPVAALAAIAIATIGFSRVLLSIPKEAATAIAIAMSANILIACAVVALRPRLSQAAMIELAIIVIYPILIGIVIAVLNIGEAEGGGEEEAAPAIPAGAVAAQDTEFSTDELTYKAGESVSIEFINQDPIAHNLAIYENASDAEAQENPIADGEEITEGTTTVEFTAPGEPDEYPFQCDLHPTSMVGTMVIER